MAFFGARGAIRAVLLTLLLIAPLPSGAEQPETPFAEVFSQLAARLVGVVVNISTTQATTAAPAKATPEAQLPPGSPLDEFFRDFFGEKGARAGQILLRRGLHHLVLGSSSTRRGSSSPTTM